MSTKPYNFDLNLDTKDFEVRIDKACGYGYFEHKELGDECGGSLWFMKTSLYDYDGVFNLPDQVVDALKVAGFNINPCL